MAVIYVAGPYRGDVVGNIQRAREVAISLWEMGHVALCPHLNTAHFDRDSQLPDERYLEGDLELLTRCDGVVMIPGWERSQGARGEKEHAEELGMPVYLWPDVPEVEAA